MRQRHICIFGAGGGRQLVEVFGQEYWLYTVENARTDLPMVYAIQEPAVNLHPEEVVEIVRYVVKDWKKVVEA